MGQGLTFWAMPIPARIIHRAGGLTGLALFQMPAQSCRPTLLDRPHGFGLRQGEWMLEAVLGTGGPENIRDLAPRLLRLLAD